MAEELPRKINILEMHSSFGYAGGQRNMFSFAKYLDRNVFQVFAASYIEGGVQEKKLNEIGVATMSAKGDAAKILKFIAENKIDAIHIHRSGGAVNIETQILQGAKKINLDIIIVEKNIFGKFDADNSSIIDCSFFQSMMHLNERYLPASGQAFDFEKMKVMYNMVDGSLFEKFRLSPEEIAKEKQLLGIPSGSFVLGRIGRPDLAKWSDLILDTAPYLAKMVPEFKFILMGVPTSRIKRINNSSLLRKHFIIQEPTSDENKVHAFYQVIDVLGHSSKIGECNGNTINEAMFWGKPVIINSTPRKDNGQLEQITHMDDGIIANFPQTFARAAAFLAENHEAYKKMSKAAAIRVKSINDPVQTVKRVEKFFIDKLAKKWLLKNLSWNEFYDKIDYYPTEKAIVEYRANYAERLRLDFGVISSKEKMANLVLAPAKFYKKLVDFMEHKLRYERS